MSRTGHHSSHRQLRRYSDLSAGRTFYTEGDLFRQHHTGALFSPPSERLSQIYMLKLTLCCSSPGLGAA